MVECRKGLYNDMRVTNDLSLSIDLLWGSKVIFISVNKVTGFEVLNGHRDGEWCVFNE